MFSLTSLGTRWAGSLAKEEQWLTLSIIQHADKGWLINKSSLLTQMTIYSSLIVRWWVISCIYHFCFLCIILWLHFWSWLILDSDCRFLALFKVGRTALLFSRYPHINTWSLIHITRLNLFFKDFPEFACLWWNLLITKIDSSSWFLPLALGKYLQMHCS